MLYHKIIYNCPHIKLISQDKISFLTALSCRLFKIQLFQTLVIKCLVELLMCVIVHITQTQEFTYNI